MGVVTMGLERLEAETPRAEESEPIGDKNMVYRPAAVVGVSLVLVSAILATPAYSAPATCFGRKATIVGTSEDDVLVGTQGRDVIVGRRGSDLIKGRGGRDLICASIGKDDIRGGGGADRLDAGPNDEADRQTDVFGGRGNDVLVAPANSDGQLMNGGPGHDILRGASGNIIYQDVLVGGPGDDVLEQQDGPSVLVPGPGDDRVRGAYSNPSDDVLDYRSSSGPVSVDLAAGRATGEGSDVIRNVDIVVGTSFNDVISGGGEEVGEGGVFRPVGERLFGEAGDDVLSGGDGDDCLIGDEVDELGDCFFVEPVAEPGEDLLLGGDGDDLL